MFTLQVPILNYLNCKYTLSVSYLVFIVAMRKIGYRNAKLSFIENSDGIRPRLAKIAMLI